CKALQKQGQTIFDSQVVAIVGGILRNEQDFLYSVLLQGARLSDHRFQRPADSSTFNQRNRAEGARPAAANRDFQIGASTLTSDTLHAFFIHADSRRLWQVIQRDRITVLAALAAVELLHQVDDIHPAACAEDAVDAGYLLDDHFTVALSQAAG